MFINKLKELNKEKRGLFTEMAIGIPGEYDFLKDHNVNSTILEFNKKLSLNSKDISLLFMNNIKLKGQVEIQLNIYKYKNYLFLLNELHEIMGFIIRNNKTPLPKKILDHYGLPIIISGLFVYPKFKNRGLMKNVFQILIDSDMKIITDGVEYENARKLLLSLNGIQNYKMDIIDIDSVNKESFLLIEDIKLKDIYDGRLWNCNSKEIAKIYVMSGNVVKQELLEFICKRAIIYKRD